MCKGFAATTSRAQAQRLPIQRLKSPQITILRGSFFRPEGLRLCVETIDFWSTNSLRAGPKLIAFGAKNEPRKIALWSSKALQLLDRAASKDVKAGRLASSASATTLPSPL